MTKIAIIYHSASGHTEVVAKTILEGVKSVSDVKTKIFKATDFTRENISELDEFDGMIFGCPTYMGSVSSQLKKFMEDAGGVWLKRGWQNKIAAGFTSSGSASGDKLNTLIQISIFAAQHSMIWVGNEDLPSKKSDENMDHFGSYLGLMTQTHSDKNSKTTLYKRDLEAAERFGARVAEITLKFNN